jgi:hypothetical protein
LSDSATEAMRTTSRGATRFGQRRCESLQVNQSSTVTTESANLATGMGVWRQWTSSCGGRWESIQFPNPIWPHQIHQILYRTIQVRKNFIQGGMRYTSLCHPMVPGAGAIILFAIKNTNVDTQCAVQACRPTVSSPWSAGTVSYLPWKSNSQGH